MEDSITKDKNFCACGCGKELIPKKHHSYYHAKFIHGHHTRLRIGDKHPNWKGGVAKTGRYIKVFSPNHRKADPRGYVPQHRLIYEEYHKCSLLDWIDIHHKNGNKQDNRIENLEPLTRSKHVKHHRIQDWKIIGRICYLCGIDKTYKDNTGKLVWYFIDKNPNKPICKSCYNILWERKRKFKM